MSELLLRQQFPRGDAESWGLATSHSNCPGGDHIDRSPAKASPGTHRHTLSHLIQKKPQNKPPTFLYFMPLLSK